MVTVALLTINSKDLSKLPKTRYLKYFDDALDKIVWMCTFLQYPEVKELTDLSKEN